MSEDYAADLKHALCSALTQGYAFDRAMEANRAHARLTVEDVAHYRARVLSLGADSRREDAGKGTA